MFRILSIFGTTMALSLGASWAETCTFTTECFENEACAETNFSMEVSADQIITDAETIPVNSGGSETKGSFVGYTASAMHILTREVGGEARYSTHMFSGPMMVNYMGSCAE